MNKKRFVLPACIALAITHCVLAEDATAQPAAAPVVAGAPAAQATDQPIAVSIYDFRSSVTELPARGATDMFMTALVKNGKFRVVERAQLNQGVMMEKQLAAQGLSDGAATRQLRAARYLFEGTISEANASESQHSGSVDIAGMSIGGGKNTDVIAVDVRVVDAQNGEVVDTITVRKAVKSTSASVSGIGNLLSTVLAQHGKNTTYTPNVNADQAHKDSLDVALREAIDESVAQLTARLQGRN